MIKTANKVFRNFVRWTGDGLPQGLVARPLQDEAVLAGGNSPGKPGMHKPVQPALVAAQVANGIAQICTARR